MSISPCWFLHNPEKFNFSPERNLYLPRKDCIFRSDGRSLGYQDRCKGKYFQWPNEWTITFIHMRFTTLLKSDCRRFVLYSSRFLFGEWNKPRKHFKTFRTLTRTYLFFLFVVTPWIFSPICGILLFQCQRFSISYLNINLL